jgi:hypothetical protein
MSGPSHPSLILSYNNICWRVQIIEVHRYAVFSSLLLLHPFWVQIFYSAPCSQTSIVDVLPLMWEIKFHNQTKLQEKQMTAWRLLFHVCSWWGCGVCCVLYAADEVLALVCCMQQMRVWHLLCVVCSRWRFGGTAPSPASASCTWLAPTCPSG